MSKDNEIVVPDIGSDGAVDVIEVFVSVGDTVDKEDSLITLESDKATMEIPSPRAGVVKEVKVAVGDKVSTGSLIVLLENGEVKAEEPVAVAEVTTTVPAVDSSSTVEQQSVQTEKTAAVSELKDVVIPDIGTSEKVDIIELMVSVGDVIELDAPLLTLESEKASMDIPAPFAGTVEAILVAVGDKVGQGDLILRLQVKGDESSTSETEASVATKPVTPEADKPATPQSSDSKSSQVAESAPLALGSAAYAGPAVRRLAREFGVDLSQVKGSGRKGRVVKEDVQAFVKQRLAAPATSGGFSFPPAPVVDFNRFGDTETVALNKIKRLTGQFTHRSWVTVPHVTQFDEADITELEAFRKANKVTAEKQGFKLTPLAFIMKAVVTCLKQLPSFNASLDPSGEKLILKKYFHIGVAVDTPNGLVVPVIRDVDKKSIFDLARELGEVSSRAREKGLMPKDMEGSCFTISSLGGIGGTAFTPIVNAPDVAILGVSKAKMQPVYQEGEFVPRLILPLSLSYDHRVIDGAEAARFTRYLSDCLGDIRRLLL